MDLWIDSIPFFLRGHDGPDELCSTSKFWTSPPFHGGLLWLTSLIYLLLHRGESLAPYTRLKCSS